MSVNPHRHANVTPLNPPARRSSRLPAQHVARRRLSDSLLASDCRLRLLCAPAGFGKTVLLRECMEHLPHDTRLLWLDLGGRVLSAVQLLTRLAAAMERPVPEGPVVEALLALLEAPGQRLWIVLDDYPRAPCAELDDCLEQLLEQGPMGVSWWLSSRRKPLCNLPRLLLQGDLLALDAQALALNPDELEQVVQGYSVALSPAQLEQLQEHCCGWLAGVCLTLLEADESSLPARLRNGTAYLHDYMQRELLAPLDDELRYVLMTLAHLPRFTSELCEHVLETPQSPIFQLLLDHQLLVRAQECEGEWWCLWAPLATALRRQPERFALAPMHLRACRWFAERGELREAVEHALLAHQPEVAANYLQRFGQE